MNDEQRLTEETGRCKKWHRLRKSVTKCVTITAFTASTSRFENTIAPLLIRLVGLAPNVGGKQIETTITKRTRYMTPLFKKLNLADHREVIVTNAPSSFEPELDALQNITWFRDRRRMASVAFAMFFVTTLKDISAAAKSLSKTKGDPVIWFAYPKKSSKNYECEFNRDNGWDAVCAAGFAGVRQVAIDSDWSALRFRRVEYIKNPKRKL